MSWGTSDIRKSEELGGEECGGEGGGELVGPNGRQSALFMRVEEEFLAGRSWGGLEQQLGCTGGCGVGEEGGGYEV